MTLQEDAARMPRDIENVYPCLSVTAMSSFCPAQLCLPSSQTKKKPTKRTGESESKRLSRRGDPGTKGWTELNSGFTQRATCPSNAD